jgi:hypothetical protein
MIRFFLANFVCLAVLCFIFYGVAHAEPSIERTIDGKTIILNALKCDTGYKAYMIDKDVVQAGCWLNDGKHVNITVNRNVTSYDKKLFELGMND